jgi:flagellar biosynthesis chaperone FliJ
MNQNTDLQNQIQKATEELSEACQQLLQLTRQKDELAEDLTNLKANYCGSLKSRKMK